MTEDFDKDLEELTGNLDDADLDLGDLGDTADAAGGEGADDLGDLDLGDLGGEADAAAGGGEEAAATEESAAEGADDLGDLDLGDLGGDMDAAAGGDEEAAATEESAAEGADDLGDLDLGEIGEGGEESGDFDLGELGTGGGAGATGPAPSAGAMTTKRSASLETLSQEQTVNLEFLLDIKLHVTFEVGRSKMLISDLLTLGQGSVIELHRLVGDELDLLVNGRLIAKGEVVVVNEKFGCKITEIIPPQERIRYMGNL